MSYIANAVTYAPAPSGDTTGATDTTSLQAALNAIPSTGGTLNLPSGTYYITSLTLPSPTTLIGEGCGDDDFTSFATRIICVSSTDAAISVNTAAKGSNFQRFALTNGASSTPTAGGGIVFAQTRAGQSFRMRDVLIRGFWINVDVQYGQDWHMESCSIFDPVHYGVHIANTDSPSAGDMSVVDCMLYSGPTNTAPAAMVRYESGGGLRFIGNKINNDTSGAPVIGLDMAVVDGVTTSDFLCVGNSIENYSQYGVLVHLEGPNNTGTWRNVAINDNQFYTSTASITAVGIAPEESGHLRNVSVSDNLFELDNGGTAVALSNVDTITVGPNTGMAVSGSVTMLSTGSGVTNLVQVGSGGTTTTITANNGTALSGAVNLAAGSNVTLTESGQTITIASTGGTIVPYAPLTNQNTPDLVFTSAGDVIACPA